MVHKSKTPTKGRLNPHLLPSSSRAPHFVYGVGNNLNVLPALAMAVSLASSFWPQLGLESPLGRGDVDGDGNGGFGELYTDLHLPSWPSLARVSTQQVVSFASSSDDEDGERREAEFDDSVMRVRMTVNDHDSPAGGPGPLNASWVGCFNDDDDDDDDIVVASGGFRVRKQEGSESVVGWVWAASSLVSL